MKESLIALGIITIGLIVIAKSKSKFLENPIENQNEDE